MEFIVSVSVSVSDHVHVHVHVHVHEMSGYKRPLIKNGTVPGGQAWSIYFEPEPGGRGRGGDERSV